MKSRGSNIDGGLFLGRWMEQCAHLTDVHYKELYTPVGPWLTGTHLGDP